MTVANIALELLIMMAVGVLVRRVIAKSREFTSLLTRVLMDIIVPAVVIRSFSSIEFGMEELRNSGYVLLASLATVIVLLLLGQAGYVMLRRGYLARIMRFGIAFTNFSAFGFAVVASVCGEEAFFYYVVFTIPMRLLYYSLAQLLLCPKGERKLSLRAVLKSWLAPAILSNLVGIVLFLTGAVLPAALTAAIDAFANCCMPFGMMVTGMIIGEYSPRRLLSIENFYMPAVRNFLIPALFAGILLLLPVPTLIKKTVFIYCTMPCGLLLAPYSLKYDPDEKAHLASAGGVLFSTVLAIVSVPAWMLMMESYFNVLP